MAGTPTIEFTCGGLGLYQIFPQEMSKRRASA